MVRYFLKRLIGLIIVLWAMTVVMFIVIRSIPGDPVAGMIGFGTPRFVIEATREQLGLDKPLYQQYTSFLNDLAHGSLGYSIETRNPVATEMGDRFIASAELVLVSMVLGIPTGVILGIIAAANWREPSDGIIRFISLLGASAPLFWVALIFQLVFFRQLGWLPVDGRIDFAISLPPKVTGLLLVDSLLAGHFEAFKSAARHVFLPALALSLNSLGLLVRHTRASLLQVLNEDFVRTARAKGLTEYAIMLRHVLKNGAIPIVTELGLQFGIILGSTFLVEIVFSWPGLGIYAVRGILNLDYPVVMGVALLFTFIYVVANFLVDLSYPLLDPRMKDEV